MHVRTVEVYRHRVAKETRCWPTGEAGGCFFPILSLVPVVLRFSLTRPPKFGYQAYNYMPNLHA